MILIDFDEQSIEIEAKYFFFNKTQKKFKFRSV
jgi:hypothetical protein